MCGVYEVVQFATTHAGGRRLHHPQRGTLLDLWDSSGTGLWDPWWLVTVAYPNICEEVIDATIDYFISDDLRRKETIWSTFKKYLFIVSFFKQITSSYMSKRSLPWKYDVTLHLWRDGRDGTLSPPSGSWLSITSKHVCLRRRGRHYQEC